MAKALSSIPPRTALSGDWLGIDITDNALTYAAWFHKAPTSDPGNLVSTDKLLVYEYEGGMFTFWIHKDLLR